jgi:hypothetical protein
MNHSDQARKRCFGERAQTRIVALVFFLMGAAVSALWSSRPPSAKADSESALSGNRNAVVEQLNSPVVKSDSVPATARTTNVRSQPEPAAQADAAALNAVKRAIPDVPSASLEQGARILREAALAEFQQTVQELQGRLKKVEQNFIEGQNNKSDEQQQAATKQLQELQAEQMEKLKQIAAKSKAQIDTFQQLKGAAH